jgi:hypothetical protein
LQALSDRAESCQAHQVHGCCAQRRHDTGAVSAVEVMIFSQLGVPDPVLGLQTPALSHQAQQRFWCGAQACDAPVCRPEPLAVADPGCDHLGDPAGAVPIGIDVLRRFIRS